MMSYVPKSRRKKRKIKDADIIAVAPDEKIVQIFDGLLLVIKGHPPSGEKAEIKWYGFNEEAAKKEAIAQSAYVYQLIYSARRMGE